MPPILPIVLLFLAGPFPAADPVQDRAPEEPGPAVTVGPVPEALRRSWNLDPFYEKHLDVRGVPILGSGKVADEAFAATRELALRMFEHRPGLAQRLAKARIRIAIIGAEERSTEIPEHRDLNEAFPQTDWDRRTRGVGATAARPAISVGEENLLGLPGDRYHGESIFLHEFAHTLHQHAIAREDSRFDRRLRQAYAQALKQGLWQDTYAATDALEYWAEGVQSWFDANRQSEPADGIHNAVDTRAELRAYDPALAALIQEWFGDGEWRYRYPAAEAAGDR